MIIYPYRAEENFLGNLLAGVTHGLVVIDHGIHYLHTNIVNPILKILCLK